MESNDKTAAAVASGIRRAFERRSAHRQRAAQYRGLPGRLPPEEQPPSPSWRLPLGSMCLTVEDYRLILAEARRWYGDSRLSYVRDMEGASPDMVHRSALDYAIQTASNYKYAGYIDAPTYARLLDILRRITAQAE